MRVFPIPFQPFCSNLDVDFFHRLHGEYKDILSRAFDPERVFTTCRLCSAFLGRFGVYQLEICVLGFYGTFKYVASTSSFYFSIALKMIQKRKMQYASPNWTVFDRSCVYAFE